MKKLNLYDWCEFLHAMDEGKDTEANKEHYNNREILKKIDSFHFM